ncbi:hypothetical protein CPB86DRAFT_196949 [Serendipita vermifera]|nr:hypothetical protein CPB86DRAFT_196949 [Serendipita vermifera]
MRFAGKGRRHSFISLANLVRLADYVANHIEQLTATTLDSENIQRIMKDLNTTFESCCGDFPGAVSVRYSHDIFMNMAQADLRNWKYENIQVTGSKCEENREKISPHVKWTSGKESSISALFQSPNTAKGKRAAQLLTHDQIYSKSGVDTKEEDIGMNLKEKGLQGNINPLGDQEVAWRHPDTNSASHRQALGQAIRGKQEEDSMHQWQQFNVSQPYPSIPRPHVRTLEFRSVKQTRFEVAVSCAIIDTKIIKDAIEVVSPLYPLKGSLGMVITLLEIVKDARRCEEEWELWATSFTDRIGMLHEYITSKQSHFGLHRPVVDYQE